MIENNTEQKVYKSYNMRHSIVNYYLFIMFTFFELFLTQQYSRARTDKYLLYIVLTCALLIGVIAISISYYIDKKNPHALVVVEQQPFFKLSITDIGMIIFFLGAVISTLLSDHVLDSITGNAGRNNGLILLALYIVMYFIISRYYYFKNYVLLSFMVFGSLISLLAILHFFYIDPLGIMYGYSPEVVVDFGTTIGNKNTIASYMCVFLPCALMMFIVPNSISTRIVAAFAIIFAYCGLLVSGSNSGYLGFASLLFFTALVCIRKIHLLRRFMLALTVMFSSGLLLRLFSFIMNDKSKGFEKIGEMLIYSNVVYIIIAFCAVTTAVLYLFKNSNFTNSNLFKNSLTVLISVVGIAALGVFSYFFYYYTVVDTTTNIGSLSQIFRFDDRWGTHRGFMWINGVKDFFKTDFINMLFGSGCDTFYHVFSPHFTELAIRFGNGSTNNIHCEYLNYLVTQGFVGLVSYMTVIISTIIRAFKTARKNELILLFVMPIIAYCAQAVVNIYTPVVTPFLFIFIAMCECLSRNSNNANRIN